MKSSKEIAMDFAEEFQNNYPKKPLFDMMDRLAREIDIHCKEYKSKAEGWDMICQLCPHNHEGGIANCCVSMQDDYCRLMRDMKKSKGK